jgi:hypothetical protein
MDSVAELARLAQFPERNFREQLWPSQQEFERARAIGPAAVFAVALSIAFVLAVEIAVAPEVVRAPEVVIVPKIAEQAARFESAQIIARARTLLRR